MNPDSPKHGGFPRKPPKVTRDPPPIAIVSDCDLAGPKRAAGASSERAVDRRTTVGKALVAWRGELISDLGGDTAVFSDTLTSLLEGKTRLDHA